MTDKIDLEMLRQEIYTAAEPGKIALEWLKGIGFFACLLALAFGAFGLFDWGYSNGINAGRKEADERPGFRITTEALFSICPKGWALNTDNNVKYCNK
jgi:hypothetical protein